MDRYYLLKERGKERAKVMIQGKGYSVNGKENTFYPDLMLKPHFMINNDGAGVLNMYMPDVGMVLTPIKDTRDNSQHMYFTVGLPLVNALSEETVYDKSGLYIEKFVLDSEAVYNLPIVEVKYIRSSYIFARLDIVESLLRRGISGFGVEEVEVV